MFYKLVGKDTYTIGTSSSGIVVNSDTNVEKSEAITPNKPITAEKDVTIKAKQKIKESQVISGNLDIVVVLDCEDTTMPYHNNHNDSIVFMNTLINAVKGKGNLSFVLTCYPNKLYTNRCV